MRTQLLTFAAEEDGAITVDWVVLTAAVIGVQIVILIGSIRESLVENASSTGDVISEYGQFLEQ